MIFKFFLLFVSVHTLHSAGVPSGKDVERFGQLYATTLIYRHGARNPAIQYPGDPYDISYWTEGWGQLTNLGKQQQFALGQWSRARYQNLLGSTFNVSDVYVRSTDVDRTIMSALSNLAGLFPPSGKQVWNKAIPWQPIPVHVIPENVDYIIGGALPPCKAYDQAYSAYLQSEEFQNFLKSIQPIIDYLSSNGVAIDNFLWMYLVRDNLFIQSSHNLTLPAWSKSIYPNNKQVDDAALKLFETYTATKFLTKFRSGFLLKDILDRYKSKVAKTLSPDLKYYAYSTHDSVLTALLNALGVFDHKLVPYAATIIFELRYYNGEYYVQLYYKNSEKTPEPINIPQCGTACPLKKMYQLYDQILPKNDFATECNLSVN